MALDLSDAGRRTSEPQAATVRPRAGQPARGRALAAPERELVRLLARGHLGAAEIEDVLRLLAGGIRWELVVEEARRQEVAPMVFRNLRDLELDVDPNALDDLKAMATANALRNALLVEELQRVLADLADAGIPTIPLKGVALSAMLYDDPKLRVCWDIDLLVPEAAARYALQRLRARGFQSEFTEAFFRGVLLRNDIECVLYRATSELSYPLELHWAFLSREGRERAALTELWAGARPAKYFGAPGYAVSLEWNLVLLAVHAARHGWRPLKWLVDVHDACSRGDVDWDQVWRLARAVGWSTAVRASLRVCHALLGTPIPDACRDGAEAALPIDLDSEPEVSPWEEAARSLRLLDGWPAKLRHALRMVVMPTLAEYRLVQLPPSLGFLYYALRPARLFGKWTGRLLAGV